jgi:hypothetical protein
MREAGLRDRLSPDLSVREKLAILHRWESAWDDDHNDNDEEDPDSCVLDFYIEVDAMDDPRADLCEYRYLDMRSSPPRREDIRSVRHVFKPRVDLLYYAFACLSSV